LNGHIVADTLPVYLASLVFRKSKLFRESLDSLSYEELLDSITLQWPQIKGEGYYEVSARTPIGELDPAFQVARWKGANYPTVIYHHGNNERPFQRRLTTKNTFHDIFLAGGEPFPANLIVVRAPFHRSFRLYLKHMGRLSTFTTLISVSVKMIEALRQYAAEKRTGTAISGISLGGWVTNLHRAFFNSADLYIPLLAGTVPGDVFTGSVYRKLTDRLALNNPEAVAEALDFEQRFAAVKENNVFPLLARYDQLIRFERQKASYGPNIPVAVIDKGHVTGSAASSALRRHILDHLGSDPAENIGTKDGPAFTVQAPTGKALG